MLVILPHPGYLSEGTWAKVTSPRSNYLLNLSNLSVFLSIQLLLGVGYYCGVITISG